MCMYSSLSIYFLLFSVLHINLATENPTNDGGSLCAEDGQRKTNYGTSTLNIIIPKAIGSALVATPPSNCP